MGSRAGQGGGHRDFAGRRQEFGVWGPCVHVLVLVRACESASHPALSSPRLSCQYSVLAFLSKPPRFLIAVSAGSFPSFLFLTLLCTFPPTFPQLLQWVDVAMAIKRSDLSDVERSARMLRLAFAKYAEVCWQRKACAQKCSVPLYVCVCGRVLSFYHQHWRPEPPKCAVLGRLLCA